MKLSVVTDEVSSDPETALEILHSWGVEGVELRGIEDTRYPHDLGVLESPPAPAAA